ncbi:hypothetical protein [Chroococcidiopsis sp.]
MAWVFSRDVEQISTRCDRAADSFMLPYAPAELMRGDVERSPLGVKS